MTTAGLLLPSPLLPPHKQEKPEPPVSTEGRAHKSPALLCRLSPEAAFIKKKVQRRPGPQRDMCTDSSPVVMVDTHIDYLSC